MNPLITSHHSLITILRLRSVVIPITLVLLSFALAPIAQAVPPPKPEDRGNGNSAAENVSALNLSTTGSDNTAHGWFSLFSNTTGSLNTADGFQALYSNTEGSANTADGYQVLYSNTTGGGNTANGVQALFRNTTGYNNAAVGSLTLTENTTGIVNTAIGSNALVNSTTGRFNTAIGGDALHNSHGDNNVALGAEAGVAVTTASNVTCIGANVSGLDESNTTWIGNVYGVTTQSGTTAPVIVSDGGQLGTVASSERFKKDIVTMQEASEAILSLRPVTFHYKSDVKAAPQFGLIAEEVAKVNPALVLPDKEGNPFTVRYDAVNAMLLNEFLKEHRKVEKLEATVAQQQKGMEVLTARLKEQDSKIQRVSDQLQLNKAAPQVVSNDQ